MVEATVTCIEPDPRARLYVGAPFRLQLALQSMEEFLQASEHGEAFW